MALKLPTIFEPFRLRGQPRTGRWRVEDVCRGGPGNRARREFLVGALGAAASGRAAPICPIWACRLSRRPGSPQIELWIYAATGKRWQLEAELRSAGYEFLPRFRNVCAIAAPEDLARALHSLGALTSTMTRYLYALATRPLASRQVRRLADEALKDYGIAT